MTDEPISRAEPVVTDEMIVAGMEEFASLRRNGAHVPNWPKRIYLAMHKAAISRVEPVVTDDALENAYREGWDDGHCGGTASPPLAYTHAQVTRDWQASNACLAMHKAAISRDDGEGV